MFSVLKWKVRYSASRNDCVFVSAVRYVTGSAGTRRASCCRRVPANRSELLLRSKCAIDSAKKVACETHTSSEP